MFLKNDTLYFNLDNKQVSCYTNFPEKFQKFEKDNPKRTTACGIFYKLERFIDSIEFKDFHINVNKSKSTHDVDTLWNLINGLPPRPDNLNEKLDQKLDSYNERKKERASKNRQLESLKGMWQNGTMTLGEYDKYKSKLEN